MTNNTSKTLNQSDLRHFTGTEQWYRHGLVTKVLYTDGARYVAQAGGAYWLLDEIAFAQVEHQEVVAEEFQKWTLTVADDQTAMLTCEDGNYNTVFTKQILFTDFPLDTVTFFFSNNVILLPSEW